VKLGTARVCLDCEELFEPKDYSCPYCGSKYWVFLSGWIDRKSETEVLKYRLKEQKTPPVDQTDGVSERTNMNDKEKLHHER